jgi:hypothetical protein
MRTLGKLLVAIFAIISLSAGVLMVDGSFKSERAAGGAVGAVLFGREVYAELIPYRPNRTYYRLVIAKSEGVQDGQ